MTVGLDTDSTATHALDRIGDLLRRGVLSDIVGIPTSKQTEAHATALNIPLSVLGTHPIVDLSIDGADEVVPGRGISSKAAGDGVSRDLEAVSDSILRLTGVVEHGMFLGLATSVIMATADGPVKVIDK